MYGGSSTNNKTEDVEKNDMDSFFQKASHIIVIIMSGDENKCNRASIYGTYRTFGTRIYMQL